MTDTGPKGILRGLRFGAGRRIPKSLLLVIALAGLVSRCASQRLRAFAPAADVQVAASLEAWKRALERADSMRSSRLLYDAHLAQGLVSVPGTLAVQQSPAALDASLSGPFGSTVASYSQGALRGQGIKPLAIAPEELRSLLAGVWRQRDPEVRGVEGDDALLVWEGKDYVEGILDMAQARFRSLAVSRAQGKIRATYSGEFTPWPSHIELVDAGTGGKLKLTLLAVE